MAKGGPHLSDLSFNSMGISKKLQVNSPIIELSKTSVSCPRKTQNVGWIPKYYSSNRPALEIDPKQICGLLNLIRGL